MQRTALLAAVVVFALGATLSTVRAQNSTSPAGLPWGGRPSAGPAPGGGASSSPEAPAPGRTSATQRPALRTLSGGAPVPPAQLAFLQEGVGPRAAHHARRAEALDGLAVRAARMVTELAPRAVDPETCRAAAAAERAVELALEAGTARARTSAALLGGEPGEIGRRLASLHRRHREGLEPALRSAGCVTDEPMPPRVHLASTDRRPVNGRVVFFVKVDTDTPVVWVDGHPEGLADGDGWAVVTAAEGSVTLCAAPPEAGRCVATGRATPAMADAYDLTGR